MDALWCGCMFIITIQKSGEVEDDRERRAIVSFFLEFNGDGK